MTVDVSSPFSFKRRRFISNFDHTSPIPKFGREIQVFEESNPDESSDEFYELTADDYYRILSTRKGEKFPKTHKMREAAEEEERRSRLTKAVIRVKFPDCHTLEATFHPSDKIQSLVDFIKRVAAPELPFELFTAPPKKVIKDMSQDFYSAGLAPAAVVHLSYGMPH